MFQCAANVEAYIDFSEDDNIEEGVLHDGKTNLVLFAFSFIVYLKGSHEYPPIYHLF